jgi:hypothetical protein
MSNARITLVDITDRILDTYNTNERWVVKKKKLEYVDRIVAILPIIYQKDKVQYLSNKYAMMISKANHGESVNWAAIMYFQLVKELIRWGKCQKNIIKGTTNIELKKDVGHHYVIILEVMFQKWFLV